MLTRLQKDLILQESDRFQRRTENMYEEMIWELSAQFGVEEDEVREVLEKE